MTADVARLAFAEAERLPYRSPGRRAAAHLCAALTVPPARTMTAARGAIASFGSETTQAAALERLATTTEGTPA